MTIEWTVNLGTPGFGDDDFAALKAKGYTEGAIRDFLSANKTLFGVGGMNVSDKTRATLGLDDSFKNYGTGASNEAVIGGAQKAYQNYVSRLAEQKKAATAAASLKEQEDLYKASMTKAYADYTTTLNLSQQQWQKQFETTRADYDRTIGEYRNQLNSLSSNYNSQLASTRSGYESQISKLKSDYDSKLGEANETAARYQQDAERYRDLSINSQLQDLRSGGSRGGGGGTVGGGGDSSLASGRAVIARSGSQGTLVQATVDATDSVLSRKGPVVETIGSAPAHRTSAASSAALARGSGASGYYARRFG